MERRLGRGLSTLIGGSGDPPAVDGQVIDAPVDQIRPNPHQPRKSFDSDGLEELCASIGNHGVLQPICVRQAESGFEIISGERRWRAARLAGLESIPAVVREDVDEGDMLELALVENIQREDLNAIEKALGYRELMERLGLSQDELASKVGLDRSTVANHLRLLELPERVQEAVTERLISMGHARALLGLDDPLAMQRLVGRIVRGDLSVRAVEELVRERVGRKPPVSKRASSSRRKVAPWVREIESRLLRALGSRASIHNGRGYRGQIVLHYHSREELDRLIERLAPDEPI